MKSSAFQSAARCLERMRDLLLHATPELEQAYLRLGVGTAVLMYVLLFDRSASEWPLAILLAVLFIVVSTALLVHIVRNPRDIAVRKYLGIVNDTSFISATLAIADQIGQPIYLVYLWVIFGNGFRFGTAYLKLALLLSIAGFGSVMLFTSYWHTHLYQGVALLAGLALLSSYFGMLLNRLTEALKAQEAANLAKRQFISSVSHELRTPLNAIIGITDLLQSTDANDRQRNMLATLKTSSRLMHTLIDDVLDFSKIEAGKIMIEQAAFDIHELVERSVGMFRPQADQKSLAMHIRFEGDVPRYLIGDAAHLQQVLINLLSNAVKFTAAGSIVTRIVATPAANGRTTLTFEVEDTGIGIDPGEQERIFESFAQASSAIRRNYGGTGLGTTISRELVELMGGHLAVRSIPKKGSTFHFTLTFAVVTDVAPDARAEAARADSLRREQTGASHRVLIADDNAINRSILQAMLERAGHVCTAVDNGEEALDQLEREAFDVMVLDLHMPVLNGIDTVKTYRIITPDDERIPIILFSADASAETEKECILAGANAFMTKPIHIERFLQLLEALAAPAGARARPARVPVAAAIPADRSEGGVSEKLDRETLKSLESIGQTSDFIDGLIDTFLADGRSNINKLQYALRRGDVTEYRHVLHAMRGSAVGIGAQALARCCQAAEGRGTNDELQVLEMALIEIRHEMVAAGEALAAYQVSRLPPVQRE